MKIFQMTFKFHFQEKLKLKVHWKTRALKANKQEKLQPISKNELTVNPINSKVTH